MAHAAAKENRLNVLKYLHEEAGMEDLNVKDSIDGMMPAAEAVIRGHKQSVEYLLGLEPKSVNTADNVVGMTLLHWASFSRDQDMLRMIVENNSTQLDKR